MRIMTAETLAISNRLMRKRPVELVFVVTVVAKHSTSLLQLIPAVALMSIMTVEAVTCSDRRVHMFFRVLALMTFIAQAGFPLVSQQKGIFFYFGMTLPGRFMARLALAVFYRQMDKRFFRLVRMASATYSAGSICPTPRNHLRKESHPHQNSYKQTNNFIW